MKRLSKIVTLAFVLAGSLAAQSTAPPLQKGISVQLAPSTKAVPMPEADSPDAIVLSVNDTGKIYFGAQSSTLDSLSDEMKRLPRSGLQKLYIKADGRVPYEKVQSLLAVGREVSFKSAILVTEQTDSANVMPAAPMGIEVGITAPEGKSLHLQLVRSQQTEPTMLINNEEVAGEQLQKKLARLLLGRPDKAVVIRADKQIQYAEVVRAIDSCRSAGAKVVLSNHEM